MDHRFDPEVNRVGRNVSAVLLARKKIK
jgi:hypothetical protein